MEEQLHLKYKHVKLTEEQTELFTEIVKQDELNIKVLFYIAQCEQNQKQVTVKSITENIRSTRRIGNKNNRGAVTSFDTVEGLIDRKTAERVVDRLSFASLIYFEIQLPYKFIRLTERGIQIAINIKQKMNNT